MFKTGKITKFCYTFYLNNQCDCLSFTVIKLITGSPIVLVLHLPFVIILLKMQVLLYSVYYIIIILILHLSVHRSRSTCVCVCLVSVLSGNDRHSNKFVVFL